MAAASIAVLGAVLALGTTSWIEYRNGRLASERFVAATDRLVSRVRDRLGQYEYGLRGARGAVIAAGGTRITGLTFRQYSQSRDLDREFPGARGIGFVQRVARSEESAFLAAVRTADGSTFEIWELAAHAGDRFVIRCVEPLERNREALGFDVASEPERRAAAVSALATGTATMTGPITLVQAPGREDRGFLLFLPVLVADPEAAARDDRHASAIGWLYAALVIDDVVAGLDLEPGHLDVAITDRPRGARFFATPGMDQPPETGLSAVRTLRMFGRTWEVAVQARSPFLTDFIRPAALSVGVVVLVVGLLGASLAYLYLLGRRRETLAAVESNRLAAIVENADEAILGKTLDGTVTDWNPAAERLFGYPAAEAVGRKAADLIFPPHLHPEEHETLAAIARGEAVSTRATLRLRQDGGLVHVLVSVSPIRARDGTIVGAATVMRDVGELVANEARIRALNADLEQQVAERTADLGAVAATQSAILRHATYAIIATDTQGRITVFNPAAERMLGYAASEVVGRSTPLLFHDPIQVADRAHRFSADLGLPIEPSPDVFRVPRRMVRPNIDEWIYVTKDGSRLPVLLSVDEMRSGDGATLGYLGIALDLTERYRHAAELRAANAGTWSYDPVSGRVRMSAECARQHGLPDAETELDVEAQWRPLAHPEDVDRVLADLAAAQASKGGYTTEFRVVLPDGRTRWLTTIGRVDTEAGAGRVIGLTLDITARKEAELALAEARQDAERASRAKGDFLAAMSHEIRTPLNAILGFTGLMLKAGRLEPEERRQTELVRSAGLALLTVVNDILDVSKVEAGAMTLNIGPFLLRRLLTNCVAIIDVVARTKGLSVRMEVDSAVPDALSGDEGRLRQVLLNLLNNAVKFTHAGTVKLEVRHAGSDAEGERLRFAVTDTGIGIAGNKQHRLFRRFSQVESSIEREFGGTGLGLAICKALVELMGGDIGVDSAAGLGSTFWFTVRLPAADAVAPEAAPTPKSTGRKGRLLLVEDNLVNRELARTILEQAGHAVEAVGDGDQAVRAAAAGTFDAVLMDVQMPGMDGLTATRAIRMLPDPAGQVPVIGMSAGVLPDQVRRCGEAGMDDHVVKPFQPDSLLDTLARWLPCDGSREPSTGSGFDARIFDAVAVKVGAERMRDVLTILDADLAQAFAEPVVSATDRSRLRFEAHTLGSAASVLGFTAVMQACRTLEALDEAVVIDAGPTPFLSAVAKARSAANAARVEIQVRRGS